MQYDFTRWYAYAEIESTKTLAWSVNKDAIYVVRFLVKNWITQDSLPRSDLTFKMFRPLCGAVSASVEQYTVRGITFMHIVGGSQVRVLDSVAGIPTLSWMDTDDGTWIVDVVFRSEVDALLMRPDIGAWQTYVAQVLGGMGLGAPTVYTMGIVTVHCGPGAITCRPMNELDLTPSHIDDPDPITTVTTEAYWTTMPDLVRSTLPGAKIKDAQAKNLAPPAPDLATLDPFETSLASKCFGVGGLQMAIGFHDVPEVAVSLTPVFVCSSGEPYSLPPISEVVPKAAAAIAGLSTNQRLVIGIFVLAGFVIAAKSRRMWA